jgi:hypothetical protein
VPTVPVGPVNPVGPVTLLGAPVGPVPTVPVEPAGPVGPFTTQGIPQDGAGLQGLQGFGGQLEIVNGGL